MRPIVGRLRIPLPGEETLEPGTGLRPGLGVPDIGGSPEGRLMGGNTERPGILAGIDLGIICVGGLFVSSTASLLLSDMAERDLSRFILIFNNLRILVLVVGNIEKKERNKKIGYKSDV